MGERRPAAFQIEAFDGCLYGERERAVFFFFALIEEVRWAGYKGEMKCSLFQASDQSTENNSFYLYKSSIERHCAAN